MILEGILITALCISLGIAFIGLSILRIMRSSARVRRNFRPMLAQKLYPFVETEDNSVENLWKAIGGRDGIFEISRSAEAVAAFLFDSAKKSGSASPEVEETILSAIILRILCPFVLGEVWIHSKVPAWPRVLIWGFARLYCNIAANFETGGCVAH